MTAAGVKVRVCGQQHVLFYSVPEGSTAVEQTRQGTMSPRIVNTTVAPGVTDAPPAAPGRPFIVRSAVARTLFSSVPFS